MTDELLEVAAKAAYEETKRIAPKYYGDEDMKRYKKWEDIGQEWRNDYKSAIRAAFKAVQRRMV